MKRPIFLLILLVALLSGGAFAQQPRYVDVTIAANASLSSAANLSACTPVAIEVGIQTTPAWTAASLTFQGSVNGTSYYNIWDEFGSEVTVSVPTAANTAAVRVRVSPSDWWGIYSVKIRSGTSTSAVNQADARTIRIVCK